MSNFALSNMVRYVLDTEDDHKSPITDNYKQAQRYMIEQLFMLLFDTGISGAAAINPPDDTTGVFTASMSWASSSHNGKTLAIASGLGKGKVYSILTTGTNTLVCSGSNLFSDGVRAGDSFKLFHDLINNVDGHDHDAVNSPRVVLADNQVVTAKINALAVTEAKIGASAVAAGKLKAAVGGGSLSADGLITISGGGYSFHPTMYGAAAGICDVYFGYGTTNLLPVGAYTACIACVGAWGNTFYWNNYYIQSSGELHWLYILTDKLSGKMLGSWHAPDHPCFGNGGDPELLPQPFLHFDPTKHDLLVCNPPHSLIWELRDKVRTVERNRKGLIQVLHELYEPDLSIEPAWPEIPVTVHLDEYLGQDGKVKKDIIKAAVPKMAYMRAVSLKARVI